MRRLSFMTVCWLGWLGLSPRNKSKNAKDVSNLMEAQHRHAKEDRCFWWIGSLWNLIPHSFQTSFFSKTCHFPCVSGCFLERRIPGKNGEATRFVSAPCAASRRTASSTSPRRAGPSSEQSAMLDKLGPFSDPPSKVTNF